MVVERQNGFIETMNAGLNGNESLSEAAKEAIIAAFCRVKPPEIPEAERYIHMIVLNDSGRKGGVSIKPGNVVLNWKRLISALPGIALTGAGATASPWLIILGALVIWKDLYSTSRVELGAQHAAAMLTMWSNHDGRERISEEKARLLTNETLAQFDMNQISETNFARILDELSKAGCIELSDGQIWLREWIRRSWP